MRPMNPSHEDLAESARRHFALGLELEEEGHLAQAVNLYQQALDASPAPVGDTRADHLMEMCNALIELDRPTAALAAARQGVFSVTSAHPERSAFIMFYLMLLNQKIETYQEPSDLIEITEAGQRLVNTIPENDDVRTHLFGLLWIWHRRRYEAEDSLLSLDKAIEAAEELMRSGWGDEDDLISNLQPLIATLHLRFERTGNVDDLDKAVDVARIACSLIGEDHPERATVISQLSAALVQRFENLGASIDLEEGIHLGRHAVAMTGDKDPYLFGMLSNLSMALTIRFDESGALSDVIEAVDFGERALEFREADPHERGAVSLNLANARHARFDREQKIDDLKQAIEKGQDALRSLKGHPAEVLARVTVGYAILAQAELQREHGKGWLARRHRGRLLRAAVGMFDKAVTLSPSDHARQPDLLSGLCQALLLRFDLSERSTDIDQAIVAGRRAVAAADHSGRSIAMYQALLARALAARFRRQNARADADEAIEYFRSAAASPTAPTNVRLNAAHGCAELAVSAGRGWQVALDAYTVAIELLPRVALRGGNLSDNERRLAGWSGLAADAAACAIEAGQHEKAVELLEQGRGVLWATLLEGRTDLGRLRQVDATLADELEMIGARLNVPDFDRRDQTRMANELIGLNRRWNETVAKVRRIPEFKEFLQPKSIQGLLPSDPDTTVVMINVSRYRCDALLVSSAGVQVAPLRDLRRDDVTDHVNRYLDVLGQLNFDQAEDAFDDVLVALLKWLWESVASPVISKLDNVKGSSPARRPRLCWCPTGALTLLPLHAAGYHHPAAGGRNVMDMAISSYTPTLTALRTTSGVQLVGRRTILAVSLPDAPKQAPLPSAARETAQLVARYPGQVTVLSDAAATRDAVRSALQEHLWAHFACHAQQNFLNPAAGGLVLYGNSTELLAVADLAGERYNHEFAYLSACDTAVGGLGNSDEAISLVAALQYTGWRHVIGTLWPVIDDTSAEVADRVYGQLNLDGESKLDFAVALHNAVKVVRDSVPDKPSAWAPYIHCGV